MKKLLLALLVISGLVGCGLSAWYIGTKQNSHSEFVEPVVGDFEQGLPTIEDPTPEQPSETLEEPAETQNIN